MLTGTKKFPVVLEMKVWNQKADCVLTTQGKKGSINLIILLQIHVYQYPKNPAGFIDHLLVGQGLSVAIGSCQYDSVDSCHYGV